MIKVNDLLSADKLGDLILCDVVPVFEYKDDGTKTDTIIAHKYITASTRYGLRRLAVKVPHTVPALEVNEDFQTVEFTNLKVGAFVTKDGGLMLSAKADDIRVTE